MDLWKRVELSGAGEPGIYLTNDKDWGTNPCCEIALRPFQFCNLCEVNASDIESQEDFEKTSKSCCVYWNTTSRIHRVSLFETNLAKNH